MNLAKGRYGDGDNATATYALGGVMDVDHDLVIQSGILDVSGSSNAVAVGGGWANFAGTAGFVPRSGTVTLDGGNQTMSGSTTFSTLSKHDTSDDGANVSLVIQTGATVTVNGTLDLDGLDANDLLALQSAKAGQRFAFDAASPQSVTFLSVKDAEASTSNIACRSCTNAGGNDNAEAPPRWVFPSVTGKLTSDEGTTPLSGKVVSVSLNGGAASGSGTTDAGGQFTVTGIAAMTGGTIVTLYVDGATEDAVTVVLGSGGNMTGISLYQNRLIVRSESGSVALTNAHLSAAALSAGSDADIAAIFHASGSVLAVQVPKELFVWTGDEFAPGGQVTATDYDINGTLTLGSNAFTVLGSWDATGGTFTTTGTGTFAVIAATGTMTSNGSHFQNLKYTGGGTLRPTDNLNLSGALVLASGAGTFDMATYDMNLVVEGNVTMDNTRTDMGNGTWTVSGNFDFKDVTTYNEDSSTLVFTASGSITGASDADLYNVTINEGITVTLNYVIYTGPDFMGTVTVNGTLSLGTTVTRTDSNGDLRVSPTGRITAGTSEGWMRILGGTLSQQDGIIDIEEINFAPGTSAAAGTYACNTFGVDAWGTGTFTFLPGTFIIAGNATFKQNNAGATLTINNGANNPDIQFKGNVTLNKGTGRVAWTKGTGTLTLSGSTATQQVTLLGESVEDIVINKTHGTVRLTGTGTLDSLLVSSGTVDFNGKAITTTGNLTIGTTGQVNPRGLPGSAIAVGGNLSLTGAAGDLLNLSATGAWTLSVTGTASASYVTAAYSNAGGGTAVDATDGTSTNGGNNTNWNFPASRSIAGKLYSDEGVTPLSGKDVSLSLNGGAWAGSGVTDAGGQYVIENI
ncbi:MAG: hypothetical protein AAB728_01995, partial [Patescibacteria group bacterium]